MPPTLPLGAVAILMRYNESPMGGARIAALALTVLLSALDGYDVLSMTFAAPAISAEWDIGKEALGALLSSGLAGMALGSFLIAPLADLIGRRAIVLTSLLVMTLGSLLCAVAPSLPTLAAARVLTGLGIGASVSTINPVAAEFANRRRRPLAVALMAMGYPLGGLTGGLLASALLQRHGWPSIFVAGSLAGAILTAVTVVMLPESPGFVLARGRRSDLVRVNAFLAQCGQPTLVCMPTPPPQPKRGYTAIFASDQRAATLRLATVNLIIAAVVYYLLSWLPQMVRDAGFPPSRASLVSAISSLVGVGGSLVVGLLAPIFGVKRIALLTMVGLGFSLILFGVTPPVFGLLMLSAGIGGLFVFSTASAFYAALAITFPIESRATGSGFVIGVGRISSSCAPLLAGWLFAAGFDREAISTAAGVAAILAAMLFATQSVRMIETR